MKYKDARIPGRIITIQPTAFAETWAKRPAAEVAVGLRRLSEWDQLTARAEAVKLVHELHDGDNATEEEKIETFNDALVSEAVAKALCHPNDVDKSYFSDPQHETREAFTTETIRMLFDEIVWTHRRASLVEPIIDAEQLRSFAAKLATMDVESIHPAVRRELHAIMTEIVPAEAAAEEVPQDEV